MEVRQRLRVELAKRAEGKPPQPPKQRVKEVKATEVQPHGKRELDTVEPVPEARKAQRSQRKRISVQRRLRGRI